MSDFYSGSYIISQNNFYIHKHVQNIGKANNGSGETDDSLTRIYQAKRQQVFKAVKTQFRNLFQESIVKTRCSDDAIRALNEAVTMKNDNIMTQINRSMGESLFQALKINKMRNLMKKELKLDDINYQSFVDQTRDCISELNKVLKVYAETCELIRNKDTGKLLAVALLDLANNSNSISNRRQYGIELQKKLDSVKNTMQGMSLSTFDLQQINMIIEGLNRLVRPLKTGKNAKGDLLKASGFQTAMLQVFNSHFAESISGEIKRTVYVNVQRTINKIKLSGAEETRIAFTDKTGQYIKDIGNPAAGKADVIFPNVSFSLNRNEDFINKDVNIAINIGISDKFYVGANFPNVITGKGNEFSAGAIGNLKDILRMIFGGELRYLYLSYNTIAWGKTLTSAEEALKGIVLSRALVNTFSARGKTDFAQYIFANGQIISIWDIIMSAQQALKDSKRFPIKLKKSLSDGMSAKLTDPNRIVLINQIINKRSLSGEFNVNTINTLMPGSVFR